MAGLPGTWKLGQRLVRQTNLSPSLSEKCERNAREMPGEEKAKKEDNIEGAQGPEVNEPILGRVKHLLIKVRTAQRS